MQYEIVAAQIGKIGNEAGHKIPCVIQINSWKEIGVGAWCYLVLYGNPVDPVQRIWRCQNLVWNGFSRIHYQIISLSFSSTCIQGMWFKGFDKKGWWGHWINCTLWRHSHSRCELDIQRRQDFCIKTVYYHWDRGDDKDNTKNCWSIWLGDLCIKAEQRCWKCGDFLHSSCQR